MLKHHFKENSMKLGVYLGEIYKLYMR